jgi:hypothetical protein
MLSYYHDRDNQFFFRQNNFFSGVEVAFTFFHNNIVLIQGLYVHTVNMLIVGLF